MDIKNVLVPTDFSQPSKIALDYGVALARQLRAQLTLLHVLEPLPVVEITTAADMVRVEKGRRESALEQLGNLVAPEDEDDLNLRIVLKTGNPRKEIATAVEKLHADLVVLGTSGRGRLGRLILGSTTAALLRRLQAPILTVCHVSSPREIKRILFATDLSESSHESFGAALEVARTFHADILAVHALGGPMLASGELGLPVQPEELALNEARRRLDALVAEGKRQGIAVRTLIADGHAAAEILKAAQESTADLILLPIETKGFLERALMGTTAEQVVREAGIPVLSVPVHVAAENFTRSR
jgi:nucleotide-binding universal stress UspA family protein